MSHPITPEQIRLIHTLLPAHLHQAEAKAELVHSFTEDPERTSTTTLTFYEAEDLIHFLRTGKPATYASYATFDNDNRQHRYILSLCHQLGWVRQSKKGRAVADLERLGGWVRKYGYLHKALKLYTAEELPRLVTQFENAAKYINANQ